MLHRFWHVHLRRLNILDGIGVYIVLVTDLLWIPLFLLTSAFSSHALVIHLDSTGRPAGHWMLVVLAFPFARADSHLLRHHGRRSNRRQHVSLTRGLIVLGGSMTAQVTYPVPLAHQLVGLRHFHETLTLHLAWRR